MNLIDSDIVLCCSPAVFDIAKKVYGDNTSFIKDSKFINRKNEFFIRNKTVFVNFYHPCWYGKKDMDLANLIKEAFEQALEIKESLI